MDADRGSLANGSKAPEDMMRIPAPRASIVCPHSIVSVPSQLTLIFLLSPAPAETPSPSNVDGGHLPDAVLRGVLEQPAALTTTATVLPLVLTNHPSPSCNDNKGGGNGRQATHAMTLPTIAATSLTTITTTTRIVTTATDGRDGAVGEPSPKPDTFIPFSFSLTTSTPVHDHPFATTTNTDNADCDDTDHDSDNTNTNNADGNNTDNADCNDANTNQSHHVDAMTRTTVNPTNTNNTNCDDANTDQRQLRRTVTTPMPTNADDTD
ncbi:hypothetical protein EDB84DRAFT_1566820 [Lactarius hengduanensis]|nr:hypothetical protein EDB84DRAFT_1566820 [Lactarius hengduanensis]